MPDRTEPPALPHGQVLIYQDGATHLQVRLEGRTVWLSQRLIAELFQVTVPTVNEHLAGIYADGELDQTATIRSFRIVQTEGRRQVARAIDHYNLDFAEDQARRKKPMHMAEWVQRLDAFLQFNERNILTHAGAVSHQLAEEHAHAQFEQYEAERRRLDAVQPTSDFDRAIEDVMRLEQDTPPRPSQGAKQKSPKEATRKRNPRGMMVRNRRTAPRKGEPSAQKYPRSLAELEECFGGGERLTATVRERLKGKQSHGDGNA